MNLHLRMLHEKSQVYSNSCPDVVADYANQYAGHHRVTQVRIRDPEASLRHRVIGSLDLFQISYGNRVHITSPEREELYHLHVLLKGRCMWRSCGEERSLAPGDLLLLNPNVPFDLTYSDSYEKFIAKLPARIIAKVCRENHWSYPSEGVRLSPVHHREQLDGFLNLLSLVCQEAESDQTTFHVQEYYAKIVVSKLLGLPGCNVSREPLEAACQSFSRLEEFIEKNIKQDISLEQLANLAHMSVHSLYALFEKHAGTTPNRFIRQRKLEAIYNQLCDPHVAVSNITAIALDYGFLHLGRFSSYYKNALGELPSDTLRRRG